jgi:sirohydrochlorin ferrochelatase
MSLRESPIAKGPGESPILVLTAHGSDDPRSAANTRATADQIRLLRPGLDVRVAFCEKNDPNLTDVLSGLDGPAVVTPLLLASAFHARVDIPAMIAEARADVLRAETLGEDPRLVELMRLRLSELNLDSDSCDSGILVVAVGSTDAAANARTATLAGALAPAAAVRVVFATGQAPSVADGIAELRDLGVRRMVLAPWFIAPGRITDRVAAIASAAGVAMAQPLGAHPLLAATVLDRFDRAVAERLAA